MMNDFKFTNVTLKPEQKYVAYCSLRYVQNMATFCFGAHGKNIPILNQIFAYLKVKNVNTVFPLLEAAASNYFQCFGVRP